MSDAADAAAASALIEDLLADFCRLDNLINNAGIFQFGEVADLASRASAGPSAGEGNKR